MFCLVASSLGHLRSQCSIVCGSSFAKGTRRVCGGVEEIGVGFQQWNVAASARLLVAMQSLDQENPPYTSAVLEFVGGGSLSVLRMRDLAEA